jgi:DNA-binding GntR family transcriptional regulator
LSFIENSARAAKLCYGDSFRDIPAIIIYDFPMSLAAIATALRGNRPSSPEVIADVIRTLILHGHIEGGQPLRQDTIAQWFGVSHIPVRESLRQLTAEGLVQLHDRRGATVAPLRPDEAEEILEIRLTLEIKAVSLAMPHWTEALFDDLEKLLIESEVCSSIDRWSDINRIFHEQLYEACARPRMLTLITSLNANVERYIRLLVSRSDYRLQAQQEHRAILASARVRNAASLAALVEHHAIETAVQLRQFLLAHQESKLVRKTVSKINSDAAAHDQVKAPNRQPV